MPSKTDVLLPLIPYLRRHASMLAGSRDLGDEHVCLCLELLMAEPARLEGDNLLVGLFRAFHDVNKTIETVDDQLSILLGGYKERIQGALGMLPLLERRAMLLFVVEEFSLEQTGYILELDVMTLRRLLIRARTKLEALVAKSVLIIEDEPLIALQLNALTSAMGFTSSRMVGRMKDAVAAAAEEQPGLVLVDLQLDGEGSGIEAAQAILQQRNVPMVFVTGYPERLSTGQNQAPAFVVTKPFHGDHIKATIGRALATYASPRTAALHRREMLARLDQLAAA